MCARWYAVGAFYPFARNHNDKNAIPQEPYVDMFNTSISGLKDKTYTDFFREAALKRYALHRYHYTHLHEFSTKSVPYFTPIFYRYPEDKEAYFRVEQNILFGESIKISPVLTGATDSITFYFPEKGSLWCPIWPKYSTKCFKGQSKQVIKVPQDEMLLHVKSGSAFLMQLGEDVTTAPKDLNLESLKNIPSDLIIHPDSKYSAHGQALFDDGLTQDLDAFTRFQFSAKGANPFLGTGHLDIEVTVPEDQSTVKDTKNQNMGSIVIYNPSLIGLGAKSTCVVTLNDDTTQIFTVD